MTFADCSREQDLIDALTTEQWPNRCDEDLKSHVAGCQGCQDLIAVVAPLGDAWAASRADAHVPASGMVWWRAQMRARQEAARAAARPITVVQVIAMLAGYAEPAAIAGVSDNTCQLTSRLVIAAIVQSYISARARMSS